MSDSQAKTDRLGPAIAGLLAFKLAINMLTRAIYPFLPTIARGLGISLSAASALVSTRWAAGMGTPFLMATVGRRRPPLTLMAIGAAVFSLGSVVTAATGVFVGAIVGFVLMGVSKPLFDIGSQTWISERVPFARRARSFGIVEISWAGGLLVGAPLFGWLIEQNGWTAPFWTIGMITAIGAIVLSVANRRSPAPATVTGNDGRTHLDREALAFVVGASLMSLAIELALVVLGEWLEMGFGFTLLALGGVGIVLGLAELVAEGGVLAFTDRLGSRRAMQIATVGMVVGFGVLTVSTTSLVAGVAALTFTLLVFEFGIVSALTLATELRPDDRPRFLSIYLVASAAGRVIADLAGPTLFDRGGLIAIAVAGAGTSLVAFTLVTRWVRRPEMSG